MNIILYEKGLELRVSSAAEQALNQRRSPLLVEMELLFSCLIRKRVRFGALGSQDAVAVSERLSIRFSPVITRVCSLAEAGDSPPLEALPLARARPFVPRWLSVDYRRGWWIGDFGY